MSKSSQVASDSGITGQSRKRRMSQREYDCMALRDQIFAKIRDYLGERNTRYIAGCTLYDYVLNVYDRDRVSRGTFYAWLRRWCNEERLEAIHQYGAGDRRLSYRLSNEQLIRYHDYLKIISRD